MPRKKRRGVKASRGVRVGRRGRPGRLAAATIEQLQAEIERRRQAVPVLHRRRDELMQMVDEIEQELSALGEAVMSGGMTRGGPALGRRRGPGRPPGASRRVGRPRGRGRNSTSLVEALHDVLRGQTMSVTEVAGAVQKAGYKTTSPNFRTIVNAALLGNKSKFQKVARGQYTAKG